MTKTFAKNILAANLAFSALVFFAPTASADDMMVMDAVARPSHVKESRTGSIYLNVMNHGSKPDKLVGVRTDAAETAELHSVSNIDGVFRMRPVADVAIGAGATVDLTKDMHIMLFGLKAPLVKDNSVRITLDFETAPDLVVDVPIGDDVHIDHAHSN
jgi:periplasmic copper chaperone A